VSQDEVQADEDSSVEMNLEDFSAFLMTKIGEKYSDGMDGLLQRFVSVFSQLARIN